MKKIIAIIIIIIFCLFLYGRYIEPSNIRIKEYTINNKEIPSSFKDLKIVQFSDILYKKDERKLDKIKDIINDQKGDIIIFTGDLFDSDVTYKEKDYKVLQDFLNGINYEIFKIAIIGNNDSKNINKYREILNASGFTVLDNESKLLFYKDNNPINIIGLTNLSKLKELYNEEYKYTICLTHKSDNFDEIKKYNINTTIAGNSLGGIVNIPYYGGLIKLSGSKKYIGNYYTSDNKELYVSNGLGYEKYEFRLFNTPSINVYRFNNE
jgi:predicted MPP superfamily phosphohydrolase